MGPCKTLTVTTTLLICSHLAAGQVYGMQGKPGIWQMPQSRLESCPTMDPETREEPRTIHPTIVRGKPVPYAGAYGNYGSQRQIAQGYGSLPAYSYYADQEADQQQVHLPSLHTILRPVKDLQYLPPVLLHKKDGIDRLPRTSLSRHSIKIGHTLLNMTIQIRLSAVTADMNGHVPARAYP